MHVKYLWHSNAHVARMASYPSITASLRSLARLGSWRVPPALAHGYARPHGQAPPAWPTTSALTEPARGRSWLGPVANGSYAKEHRHRAADGWKHWLSVVAAATVLAGGLASMFHRDNATARQSSNRSRACPCRTI